MENNLILLAKELRNALPQNVKKNVNLVLSELDLGNGYVTETIKLVVKRKDIQIASISTADSNCFWFGVDLEIDSSKIYCLPSKATQVCSGDLELLIDWEYKDLLVREFKFNYKDVEDKIFPENFS